MARKIYNAAIVDVPFDGGLCQHAAECVRGMPAVFDTKKRPWINPANADTAELAAQLADELVVFTHTEVEPAFEGQGVGSAIAGYALAQLKTDGTRKALALCPFIKGWIQRHPEYLAITYGAKTE